MNWEEIQKKTGCLSQIAGITRARLTEGRADGTDIFSIRTGSGFQFTVLPGRGMDLAWASYRGTALNYMTKAGIGSAFAYDGRGMNWLYNFFGGLLTTCGLDNVGGPRRTEDAVIGTRERGLHGRISNTPAEQVSSFEGMQDGRYIMQVGGLMRDALLHCEDYRLRRTIRTELGRSGFTLRDEIENCSQYAQPVSLLYHINAGWPLLDACSRVVGRARAVIPADRFAAQSQQTWMYSEEPQLGIAERCYALDLQEDAEGNVHIAIINETIGLGFALRWQKSSLPLFNLWKMTNEKEYVFGLEPCTALPWDADAQPQKLGAGCSQSFCMDFEVLSDENEIEQYCKLYG